MMVKWMYDAIGMIIDLQGSICGETRQGSATREGSIITWGLKKPEGVKSPTNRALSICEEASFGESFQFNWQPTDDEKSTMIINTRKVN